MGKYRVKFRVVTDNFAGYEVQAKRWWFPFWIQCHANGRHTNTFSSLETAKEFIRQKKEVTPQKKHRVVYTE